MMINMVGYVLGLDGGWDSFDDGSDEFQTLQIPMVTATLTEQYAVFGDSGNFPGGTANYGSWQMSWASGGPGVMNVTYTFFGAPILSVGYTIVGFPAATPTAPKVKKTKNPSKACQALAKMNASGTLFGYPATQTVSVQTGLTTESSSGDISIGGPGVGTSLDTTINPPEGWDSAFPGLSAVQMGVGLGKFVSVGTFMTSTGVQGFVFSLGYGLAPPITASVTVANPCE
jgi:hypothetical protein